MRSEPTWHASSGWSVHFHRPLDQDTRRPVQGRVHRAGKSERKSLEHHRFAALARYHRGDEEEADDTPYQSVCGYEVQPEGGAQRRRHFKGRLPCDITGPPTTKVTSTRSLGVMAPSKSSRTTSCYRMPSVEIGCSLTSSACISIDPSQPRRYDSPTTASTRCGLCLSSAVKIATSSSPI